MKCIIYGGILLLVGCVDTDVSKLDRQLAESRGRAEGRIVGLPQTPLPQRVIYDQAGERSPFMPGQAPLGTSNSGIARMTPKSDRVREPLEAYPLESLRLIGTLHIDGQRSALLRDPQGHVHRLYVGNYMGANHGHIAQISNDSLELIEIISAQGGWRERSRTVSLNNDNHDSLGSGPID